MGPSGGYNLHALLLSVINRLAPSPSTNAAIPFSPPSSTHLLPLRSTRKHVPFTNGTLKYRLLVTNATSAPIYQAVLNQFVCAATSSSDKKVITLPSAWKEDSGTSGMYVLKGEQSVKKSKVVPLIHSFGYSVRTHQANFTSDEAYATVVLLRMNLAGVFNLTSFSSRSMRITV